MVGRHGEVAGSQRNTLASRLRRADNHDAFLGEHDERRLVLLADPVKAVARLRRSAADASSNLLRNM